MCFMINVKYFNCCLDVKCMVVYSQLTMANSEFVTMETASMLIATIGPVMNFCCCGSSCLDVHCWFFSN